MPTSSIVPQQKLCKNRVLTSIPASDFQRLSAHLTPINFKSKHSLHDAGERIDIVYFLENAVASVVITMENGHTVEVGLIGMDGVVGLPAVMGSGYAVNETFIQIPGRGFSVKARVLRELVESSSKMRSCFYLALEGYLVQTAQTAACNRIHELEERLARWLIMCSDRIQSDHIPITHEFLAVMLGTRRSSVTVAAGMLDKAGLITHTRGSVTIQNRDGLLHAACECYQSVHEQYLRLRLL